MITQTDIISLKPISDLLKEDFFVPSYQRGYRWTETEVKALLDDIYEFIIEFDDAKTTDFNDRKAFLETLGEDVLEDVTFYESYKNVLRYRNDKYLIVCGDYRYGFSLKHSVNALVLYPDEVLVYKIKKENK